MICCQDGCDEPTNLSIYFSNIRWLVAALRVGRQLLLRKLERGQKIKFCVFVPAITGSDDPRWRLTNVAANN